MWEAHVKLDELYTAVMKYKPTIVSQYSPSFTLFINFLLPLLINYRLPLLTSLGCPVQHLLWTQLWGCLQVRLAVGSSIAGCEISHSAFLWCFPQCTLRSISWAAETQVNSSAVCRRWREHLPMLCCCFSTYIFIVGRFVISSLQRMRSSLGNPSIKKLGVGGLWVFSPWTLRQWGE